MISENIAFFDNSGKKFSTVNFKNVYDKKKSIVYFNFIEDELLMVVLESGEYYLVEPYIKKEPICINI